ncbi:MAG: cytochrome C [Deltaproteobacteria bacterium]|nr:MAG: cytochrome C [Deltaproteobacteria bacterium]
MAEATNDAAAAPAAQTPKKKKIKGKLSDLPNRIHTWPYLVRMEFLCALVIMIVMTVWSINIDAPTEQAADPNRTPNPSKAPWYFLGLQEMLVYFDPWFAGVVLPSLIIVGLMVIPYIDINPRGNGYYTVKERKFAVSMFMFGFLVLWIALIVIGTFFRGPGWNLFWPWQYWDPHKTVALTNVDLPYQLGARTQSAMFLIGAIATLGYYPGLAIVGQFLLRKKPVYQELGAVRYHIVAFLFLMMMALPLKMFLRLAFNTKYIWVTPWFNI